MALRLRRDVQKASYYVWFLGAEEAKGLRGQRVINSVLPYLIDRSRTQEPIKVTLQVSHKGIKIIQGSSKHFIPHSAITSSLQTDDIVACVLLLYNPVTKCPLHVHGYRCDSETTAEALNLQLQILINRPENQKRYEELESRLGILPPMMPPASKTSQNSHRENMDIRDHLKKDYDAHHQRARSRVDASPRRFGSSLGSDTGNSTRESECSEEHSGNSPISRSPPTSKSLPPQQQNNELFDSLAAELRAKLNGNGPPLLLPPRDYDTVHRSKGNLTAIELRRCRNKLIVGTTKAGESKTNTNSSNNGIIKQVSSRGSSGIGSDLAPSPERQDINSSSDDEHWTNEADSSVIALKPSQIALERSNPIAPQHSQLNRKSAIQPPDDSYLRDLPAKPYTPRSINGTSREKPTNTHEKDTRTFKSNSSWSREDEIKPIIMRPADYDAKINRVLQSEQQHSSHVYSNRSKVEVNGREKPHHVEGETINDISRLLKKNLSLDRDSPNPRDKYKSQNSLNELDDSDPPSDARRPSKKLSERNGLRKENLTDKQKSMEYATALPLKSKIGPTKSYAAEEVQRYGGKHRYVDPADLPFEQQISGPNKFAAIHRSTHSPDPLELTHRSVERQRERSAEMRDVDSRRQPGREDYSRSKERNPYREPESIPYIESMEKMMKSSAMRYKSYETKNVNEVDVPIKEPLQAKFSQRSNSHSQHEDEREYNYNKHLVQNSKDRYKDPKDKFRGMERSGSRYELAEDRDGKPYKYSRRDAKDLKRRSYEDWSDEERLYDTPPPEYQHSRSRSRDRWIDHANRPENPSSKNDTRGRDIRPREESSKRHESRDQQRYHEQIRHNHRPVEHIRDHSREYNNRRDYSPDLRSGSERSQHRTDRSKTDKHHSQDAYPSPSPTRLPNKGNNAGSTSLTSSKGYRHSFAEPVFSRTAGRVGLAAVNPY